MKPNKIDVATAVLSYVAEETKQSLTAATELAHQLGPLIENGATNEVIVAHLKSIIEATTIANEQLDKVTSEIIAGNPHVFLEIFARTDQSGFEQE